MKQQTKEWKNLRKNKIGASDAPIIMGVSPFFRRDGLPKTPLTLWKEKLDLLPEESPTSAMSFGIDKEGNIRDLYKDITGIHIHPEVIFHKDNPYLMASLDGISEDKQHIVEIKCANEEDHEMAHKEKIPEKYFPQLQHQINCAGLESVSYVSYHKGDIKIVPVALDQKYLNGLLEKEEEFWECLKNFKEPSLIDKDYIERDEEWYRVASELKSLKKQKKAISEAEKSKERELRSISKDQNSFYNDLKYFSYTRKGAVDYASIPELKGVDLETYRKRPLTVWKIS